jgi:hypothetical protein
MQRLSVAQYEADEGWVQGQAMGRDEAIAHAIKMVRTPDTRRRADP